MLKSYAPILLSVVLSLMQFCVAQDASADKSWTSSTQQQDPGGAINPTRTNRSHTEAGGHVIDKTSVDAIGPDGRYVPYSDTERESVRVNATTVRNIERTYGRGPNGQKTLVQERLEESSTLPGGEQKVVRTISNPDANGGLQVVRRESRDSRELSPGLRETKTTVLTPDINGGLSPSVQIEEREKQNGPGTVEYKKSTMLSDGAGHWQLSEIKEGTLKEDSNQGRTREERVLRPDSNGKFAIVERTVSQQIDASSGESRESLETYSTNVPGQAGNDSLQLVQRETKTHRNIADGEQRTVKQVEQPSPGAPSGGLQVTGQTIDIVRPGANGIADQRRVVINSDPNGRLQQVWIDVGKTGNPAAIKVDTSSPAKPH